MTLAHQETGYSFLVIDTIDNSIWEKYIHLWYYGVSAWATCPMAGTPES